MLRFHLVFSMTKTSPANAGGVEFILSWKDILEKKMTTHFYILPWEISWTGGCQATVHGIAKAWTQLSN